MIDKFALLVTHGLMLLTAWRLLSRPDLHQTEADEPSNSADLEPKAP
ncbi:hypothetical protein HFP51_01435 [Parasphingopyxis sp. CP4]|nr:hypothetical protein [Parasphingopyxis sp. CP4]QLC20963.1 hypothetical protein HFP51_01435 [Parasphingopyxis sp. CP4]